MRARSAWSLGHPVRVVVALLALIVSLPALPVAAHAISVSAGGPATGTSQANRDGFAHSPAS